MTTSELAKRLNVSRRTISRDIDALKKEQRLMREGTDKLGKWKVL